jgi:hypothetical protein
MTIGADNLLKEYGSPLGVAEALLKGELNSFQQQYASEAIGSQIVLKAAALRLAMPVLEAEKP